MMPIMLLPVQPAADEESRDGFMRVWGINFYTPPRRVKAEKGGITYQQ